MKKEYISPSISVYAVQISSIMAASGEQTMGIGGNAASNTTVDSRDDDDQASVWDD